MYTDNLAVIMKQPHAQEAMIDIIKSWGTYGLPEGFSEDSIEFGYNFESGYFMLSNDDYQSIILNPKTGKLEPIYCLFDADENLFIGEIIERLQGGYDNLSSDDVAFIYNKFSCDGTLESKFFKYVLEDAVEYHDTGGIQPKAAMNACIVGAYGIIDVFIDADDAKKAMSDYIDSPAEIVSISDAAYQFFVDVGSDWPHYVINDGILTFTTP